MFSRFLHLYSAGSVQGILLPEAHLQPMLHSVKLTVNTDCYETNLDGMPSFHILTLFLLLLIF